VVNGREGDVAALPMRLRLPARCRPGHRRRRDDPIGAGGAARRRARRLPPRRGRPSQRAAPACVSALRRQHRSRAIAKLNRLIEAGPVEVHVASAFRSTRRRGARALAEHYSQARLRPNGSNDRGSWKEKRSHQPAFYGHRACCGKTLRQGRGLRFITGRRQEELDEAVRRSATLPAFRATLPIGRP